MRARDYLIIVNPTAGHGRAGRTVPQIEALMQSHKLDYELVLTEGPWHAADLAQAAAESGVDVVVAAGGDGTANEVLNGLMRLPQAQRTTAMGILCVGRGNDFAFGAGIPMDLEAGVRALSEGCRRLQDVGYATGGDAPEGRYFGNGIGIGFDTVVGLEAAKLKRLHGFAGYVVAALMTTFLYYRAPLLTLEYDDAANGHRNSLRLPALMVSVMNGRRMGGGFLMAPDGDPRDGLFDLCIARQVSRLHVLALVPHFMRGSQATRAPISTARTRHLTVTTHDGALPTHADGELLCTAAHQLQIRIIPNQIHMVTSCDA
jgi:diacylglycerol kinase (ATP)